MKVIMIAATTLCGRISPAPLGSDLDRKLLESMRDRTDASLMGSGTLRKENPEMRGTGGISTSRLRSFITRNGDIPVQGKKIFQQGPAPLFFTAQGKKEKLAKKLNGIAKVVALPEGPGGLSVAAAIAALQEHSAQSVLIEGGAVLNYHALQEKVVDEIMLTITPQISGHKNAESLADGPQVLGRPFLNLEMLSVDVQSNGEIFAHYKVNYEVENA